MRIGRLLAFVFSALAFLCAPLVAQTIVTNVNALRAGTVTAGTTVLLAGYVNAQDGGGGMLYSITGSCGYTNYANSVAGKVVTVPNTFNFTKIALNMLFTGVGVANDPVTAFDANALTITLLTAPTMSMGSFSLNGDNGGTIFVTSSGVCWYRASQTYSQAEWGAGTGYTTSYITDDTTLLQNWINAQQPHIAVPGTSVISSPLTCVGTAGTFSGPPRSGTTEINGPVPLFQIVSATGFTGSAMLEMDPGGTTGGCAIHNVGLIADGTGNFDTVDAYGQADLVEGSYLFGGKVNFNCNGAGEDVEIFDSFLSQSYYDNIDSACPNFRVIRNVIAQAGGKVSSAGVIAAGKGIRYSGSEAIIANNTIETSSDDGVDLLGAQKVRFANNYVDRNGTGVTGAVGLRVAGATYVTACDNVFSLSGSYSVPSPVSHIYLSGAIESLKLCGNAYYTDNQNGQALMFPNYVYDADPNAKLTHVDISENTAPADLGVFSPNALTAGLANMVSPHVWQNYFNGFALTDAPSGGHPGATIGAGDAPDSTNSFPIALPGGCSINLGTVGEGGVDVSGSIAVNTPYYLYAISGPGGRNPGCIASLNPPVGTLTNGPSFVSAGTVYTIDTVANLTSGSTLAWNVGQGYGSMGANTGPHGKGAQQYGWPIKGMAIGNLVTDTGSGGLSAIPANTTVSALNAFQEVLPPPPSTSSCTITAGAAYIGCPSGSSVANVQPNMYVSVSYICACASNGKTVPFSLSSGYLLYTGISTSCTGGSPVCFAVSGTAPTSPPTTSVQVAISGNLSIAMSQVPAVRRRTTTIYKFMPAITGSSAPG